ncbi:MAG: hypothetical protein HKM89_09490 [Gemmatimonadales bacterium]|nr:hypothetical protein [Gemmatimonadales bacterium]
MKLWLLWVLASTVAFGVGGRLGVALSPSKDLIVIAYLAVTASLILAGVLQWLVLRRLIADTGWWVLVSVGAVAIVGVLVFGLGLINRDVGWVLGVAVGWIVLGALQWLVLREQVAGAGWWVLANTLGLIVAVPVVGFVTWAIGAPADSAIGGFLRWLAFGAAYGVVTGTTLSWLLRQRLELAMP